MLESARELGLHPEYRKVFGGMVCVLGCPVLFTVLNTTHVQLSVCFCKIHVLISELQASCVGLKPEKLGTNIF